MNFYHCFYGNEDFYGNDSLYKNDSSDLVGGSKIQGAIVALTHIDSNQNGKVADNYRSAFPRVEIDSAVEKYSPIPLTTYVQLRSAENSVSVSSLTVAGSTIKFCGIGALAAAQYCFTLQLNLQKHDRPIAFQSNALGYHQRPLASWSAVWKSDRAHLRFPRMNCRTVEDIPTRVFAEQNFAAIRQAFCGDERGYWVIELADDQCVQDFVLDAKKLCHFTRRALIVTAVTRQSNIYVMRYFAPQYDVPEDAATGSANVVLADYWHQRLNLSKFIARQLSFSGAIMEVEVEAEHVLISGRCRKL